MATRTTKRPGGLETAVRLGSRPIRIVTAVPNGMGVQARSANDWIHLAAEHHGQTGKAQAEVVPPGWQTYDEIMAETGWPKSTTIEAMGNLVRAGKAERKTFRIYGGQHRGVRARTHWRRKP